MINAPIIETTIPCGKMLVVWGESDRENLGTVNNLPIKLACWLEREWRAMRERRENDGEGGCGKGRKGWRG